MWKNIKSDHLVSYPFIFLALYDCTCHISGRTVYVLYFEIEFVCFFGILLKFIYFFIALS